MLNQMKVILTLYVLTFLVSCAPPKAKKEVLDQISAVTACKQISEEIRTIQFVDTINGRRVMFNVERSSGTVVYVSATQNCVLTSTQEAEAIVERFKNATLCIDTEENETEKPDFLVISTDVDGYAAGDPSDSNVRMVGQTFAEFQDEVDAYALDFEALGSINGPLVDTPGTIVCTGEGSVF